MLGKASCTTAKPAPGKVAGRTPASSAVAAKASRIAVAKITGDCRSRKLGLLLPSPTPSTSTTGEPACLSERLASTCATSSSSEVTSVAAAPQQGAAMSSPSKYGVRRVLPPRQPAGQHRRRVGARGLELPHRGGGQRHLHLLA
jgi:hypothetical protein